MGRAALIFLLLLPGVVGMVVFGFFALVDWAALDQAYLAYDQAVQQAAEFDMLYIRATNQNVHRVNVFAEGVWFLLSAVIAAIAVHGLAVKR
ncbi:MAG: hypothetical protein ACFBSG_06525 [Leptolyngbyaceae cyanobacterium]